ncbi:hypothetical protein QLS31_04100 [Flavobacterium sp. XS2P24]|uniref:hypothetical protein n=1 Tax=Flavobacterium sp. XS2P24 TaxID=3041249 RepID=UPI0024A90516|nr:hypothetical protein [Flavobacterium sp. XS2P24]MDI6049004.1 hypothetical protein [Flavobacterium sp. XS2P24]
MTTYKTLRSYEASERRIEKARQKTIEIQNAYKAVTDWKNYVLTLKTIHLKSSPVIDWIKIKNTEKPYEPKREYKNEDFAKNKLENFKPTFLDKLFGLIPKKINKLKEFLEQAKVKDENENDANYKKYLDNLKDWEKLQEISLGVEKSQIEFYEKALEYFSPFSKISELGNQININLENDFIDVDLTVNGLDVIPDYELKQTSTGKLSKTNMPKTRFNELYQQHVCSCVLRVGREVFAHLPYKYSRVNAITKIINLQTGNIEEKIILSVIFASNTLQKLNFGVTQPSDNIQSFFNNMIFHKINGFNIISRMEFNK